MERNEIILQSLKRDGRGLEIGPMYAPIAPKRDGFNVEVIDHCSREELVRKYIHQSWIDTSKIEEVDYVWSGQSYAELTGKHGFYDWVIASHVIEHVTDFIGFLRDCAEVLAPDGVLSLAVPDKRYCFDSLRPASGIGKVIDKHLAPSPVHSIGSRIEYDLCICRKNDGVSWERGSTVPGDRFSLFHDSAADLRAMLQEANTTYADCHEWCFTPAGFRLIVDDLYHLGLIPLREMSFHPTRGYEFFIQLGRSGAGMGCSRLEMLCAARDEAGEY